MSKRLTRKEALRIAMELWTWLAETGEKSKARWPGWLEYGYMRANCPLCEYTDRHSGVCEKDCPYCVTLQKTCLEFDSAFSRWCVLEGNSEVERKQRQIEAKEFLKELEVIIDGKQNLQRRCNK